MAVARFDRQPKAIHWAKMLLLWAWLVVIAAGIYAGYALLNAIR